MPYEPKADNVQFDQFIGRTRQSMEYIAEHGVSGMSEQTLKRVGHSIIRTAKKRIRELEMAGYTDVPAYRYYKNHIGNFTLSDAKLNKARYMVSEAYKFLLSKTSTVKGAQNFLSSTIEKWVGTSTSKEQREKIFDLFDRIETRHPSWFARETYSSAELAADIYTISEVLSAKDWDIDEAISVLEREAGTTILFDDDLDDVLMDEVSMWFERHE